MFRGTFTALVTPFRGDAVDFGALDQILEGQVAAGIDGVVAIGTTGESPTLTHEERASVIRRCVERIGGRSAVLAGTGSYSTRDAIAATQAAEKMGVERRAGRLSLL